MKRYIKPAICIQEVCMEQLMAASEPGQIDSSDAKRNNDFWTDNMDEPSGEANAVWE